MPMIPWKQSIAFRTYFRFFGRTGVTGWTLEVARSGVNIANTGWAVAEVDATNNAYLYTLTATAAALATMGVYDVTVYETAAPANSWSFQLKVTLDGTWEGATGTVSWTSSASDGRVTDGASAISGATVRLLSSTNVVQQEASTDSAGLATLYLDNNTAYNLTVSASGYVTERQVSALIVSSNTVITSPGADFALSAASTSSETLSFAELIAYARRQKANAASEQATTEIKEAINQALFWLASEYPWPHLATEYQVCLYAPYSTGTITITTGTATVTGIATTFPTWAASAWLEVNDVFLEVSTRDSNTQLTLTETYDAATLTAQSYKLHYTDYTKPAGLLGIQRFLDYGDTFTPVSSIDIALERNARPSTSRNGFAYNLSDGKIKIWPCPTTTTVYKYIGTRRPTTLIDDDDIADWDPSLGPILHRAIDWQLAIRGQCKAGDVNTTWTTLQNAIGNAWGGMQDHRDRDFVSGDAASEDIFDGTMTDM